MSAPLPHLLTTYSVDKSDPYLLYVQYVVCRAIISPGELSLYLVRERWGTKQHVSGWRTQYKVSP